MSTKLRVKGKLRTYLQTPLLLGGILLLVNIWIYLVSIEAGVILSVFLVIYLAIIGYLMFFSRQPLNAELISFATEYGQIQRELLRELELPHALLDETGRLIWMNTAFEQLGSREQFYRKPIVQSIPAIRKEMFPTEEEPTREFDIAHDDKDYQMRLKRISLQDVALLSGADKNGGYDGYLIAVYLFDHTALKLALREVDDQSLVVGFIYIDNYEEALESVEDVGRSLLVAFIDRQVNQYVASIDGIVRKTEKDKYLVIMRKSALTQLTEKNFHLLDDVKGLNIGNTTAVTLSIGIGVDGLTYAQNCEFARNAIDLALGRGGDQAVVKSPGKVDYYGGKSEQKGNSKRVKARVKAQALEEIITIRDRVFVMGHRNGDIDSFGASVGIRAACGSLSKECYVVLDEINNSLQPFVDIYRESEDGGPGAVITSQQALEMADGNTVVVVVDVNRPSITQCPELLKSCKAIVVLDHHRLSSEQIENPTLAYVESNASSACEMVAEILQYFRGGVKFSQVVADCLYAGIVMDTQSFTAKTGVRTFEAAAYLRRNAADVTRVRKMFREEPPDYKAKAEVVRRAEVYRREYVISVCDPEGLKSPTVIAAQAANELLNINGVKASFVLTDYQGKIFISARSIDEVNVQRLMEQLGGGGHMNIAGAQLEDTTIEAATIVLKNILDTMLQEGERK